MFKLVQQVPAPFDPALAQHADFAPVPAEGFVEIDLPFTQRLAPEGDWFDLYPKGTRKGGLYHPDSIRHPAKMSKPLLRRIIQEMLSCGWLQIGGVLVDPFGGIGATAVEWCALDERNLAVTCELEAPFIKMQDQNRATAESLLGRELRWVGLRGDSRTLHERYPDLLTSFQASGLASPPYGNVEIANQGAGDQAFNETYREYAKTGTPEALLAHQEARRAMESKKNYGRTPGQIGGMLLPDSEFANPGAALASPPYGKGTIGSTGAAAAARLRALTQDPSSSLFGRNPEGSWFQAMEQGYINSPGNIDLLSSDADLDAAALGSPPYEESLSGDDPVKRGGLFKDPKRANDRSLTANYSVDPSAVGSPPFGKSHSGNMGKMGERGYEGDARAYDENSQTLGARQCIATGTPGQIGDLSLPDSEYPISPAAVTSAPYEAQSGGHGAKSRKGMIGETGVLQRHAASNSGAKHGAGYAENTPGQIGVMRKESYSSACRDVYRSLNALGVRYVVLVTKNPIRKQALKRLDLLTIQLMADAGYVLRARRRAYLWQTVAQLAERGVVFPQPQVAKCKIDERFRDNWGERPTGNISFFHTNHMAHGLMAPAQWEDVLFFERVAG